MNVDFAEQLKLFLAEEKNLHWLRTKLFNLDGYLLQSNFVAELNRRRSEDQQIIANLKTSHAQEISKLNADRAQEIQCLKDKNKAYRDEAEQKLHCLEQTKSELAHWREDYGDLNAVYKIFAELSDKHRKDVAGIFGGCDSPLNFIFGAVQKVHLEQFWDYVCDELATNADADSQKLSALFDFSFTAVNSSQNELLYKRLKVSPGARFDGDTMRRTHSSLQLGRVKRLVFAGFSHNVTGKVVRCSLVELE